MLTVSFNLKQRGSPLLQELKSNKAVLDNNWGFLMTFCTKLSGGLLENNQAEYEKFTTLYERPWRIAHFDFVTIFVKVDKLTVGVKKKI
jgi:hypothetical protein